MQACSVLIVHADRHFVLTLLYAIQHNTQYTGIYYPSDSLKTRLCVQGRKKLYEYCQQHDIPHRKTQKLVVAVTDSQKTHLEQLYKHATSLPHPPGPVPVQLISGKEARSLEPDLSENVCGALLSPETGIIDAHSLIERMEAELEENGESATVYGTSVVRIDKSDDEGRGAKGKRGDSGNPGWIVQTRNESGERSAILARCVINSAGLKSVSPPPPVPESRQLTCPVSVHITSLIRSCPKTSVDHYTSAKAVTSRIVEQV